MASASERIWTVVDGPPPVFGSKGPTDTRLVGWDWSSWLPEGATISGAPTLRMKGSTATLGNMSVSGAVVQALLSGGSVDDQCLCLCTIVDSLGETETRGFIMTIEAMP